MVKNELVTWSIFQQLQGIIMKENGSIGDAERMFIQARFFAPDKAKALVDKYSR